MLSCCCCLKEGIPFARDSQLCNGVWRSRIGRRCSLTIRSGRPGVDWEGQGMQPPAIHDHLHTVHIITTPVPVPTRSSRLYSLYSLYSLRSIPSRSTCHKVPSTARKFGDLATFGDFWQLWRETRRATRRLGNLATFGDVATLATWRYPYNTGLEEAEGSCRQSTKPH